MGGTHSREFDLKLMLGTALDDNSLSKLPTLDYVGGPSGHKLISGKVGGDSTTLAKYNS
jgi:hypothetical protein